MAPEIRPDEPNLYDIPKGVHATYRPLPLFAKLLTLDMAFYDHPDNSVGALGARLATDAGSQAGDDRQGQQGQDRQVVRWR